MAQLDFEDDDMDRKFMEIRARFLNSLGARMEKAYSTLPAIAGDSDIAARAVEAAYSSIHSLCGMAGTVGYPRIGQLARRVDNVLVTAYRNKRGLTGEEEEHFNVALRELGAAIRTETGLA